MNDDELYEGAVRLYRNLLAATDAAGQEPDRGHSVVSREQGTVLLRTVAGATIHAFDFSVGEDDARAATTGH